ncbi:MAG TPA: GDP-mannose 4,6-dehydratase [Terriglobales bacterium]|nr:GDP-mannose 4,6-dehydratase [Terriglobales bacterium]
MRSLITGVNGFVGRHLAKLLAKEAGAECWACSLEKSSEPLEKVVYGRVDIRSEREVAEFVGASQARHIYHLAAVSTISAASSDQRVAFDVNVWGTRNLLEAAARLPDRARVLNVSSSQVYGSAAPAAGIAESVPLRPANMYAVTKAMAELWGWQYGDRVAVITARAFNHTGPGQPTHFVLSSLAQQVAAIAAGISDPVIQVGDLSVERDFTDVRDVVRAYALLLEQGKPGEVYNVCSGKAYRLSDLLQSLLSQAGVTARIERDPARSRSDDPPRIHGDNRKLRDATGWAPAIPIEDTMRDLLEFWRARIPERFQV